MGSWCPLPKHTVQVVLIGWPLNSILSQSYYLFIPHNEISPMLSCVLVLTSKQTAVSVSLL